VTVHKQGVCTSTRVSLPYLNGNTVELVDDSQGHYSKGKTNGQNNPSLAPGGDNCSRLGSMGI
jgi:hypothetical protein